MRALRLSLCAKRAVFTANIRPKNAVKVIFRTSLKWFIYANVAFFIYREATSYHKKFGRYVIYLSTRKLVNSSTHQLKNSLTCKLVNL